MTWTESNVFACRNGILSQRSQCMPKVACSVALHVHVYSKNLKHILLHENPQERV